MKYLQNWNSSTATHLKQHFQPASSIHILLQEKLSEAFYYILNNSYR